MFKKNGIIELVITMKSLNNITVTEIEDIISVFSHKGRRFDVKNRPFFGISFCCEGEIVYKHCGKEFISDSQSAVILPKGASYTLYGSETGRFPLINFDCTGFSPDTFTVIPLKNPESYIKDFERMYSLSLFSGNRAAVMGLLYSIIDRLCTEQKNGSDILAPAKEYITEHFSDPSLNNAQLAELCRISEVYFRKLFALDKGISPKQYIIDIRITKAKQLLCGTGLSVEKVSELTGFSSVYHFCRCFKDKTGMTPTEYAKSTFHFVI